MFVCVCVCGGGGGDYLGGCECTICYLILVEDTVIRKLLGAGCVCACVCACARSCAWGWWAGGGGALDRCAHGFYKQMFYYW